MSICEYVTGLDAAAAVASIKFQTMEIDLHLIEADNTNYVCNIIVNKRQKSSLQKHAVCTEFFIAKSRLFVYNLQLRAVFEGRVHVYFMT